VAASPASSAAVARYVVKTDTVAAADAAAAHVQAAGGVVTNRYRLVFPGLSATTTAAEATALASRPGVVSVTPDAATKVAATQTDPPWGLDRVDQLFRPLDHRYSYDSTGSGVTAFVLDSGVRRTHTQFGGRVSGGYDFVSKDSDPSDCYGHGTSVAATIGGSTYGVAKQVKLVSVRVFDCAGQGYFSNLIAGADWVLGHRPSGRSVVNISGGGPAYALVDQAVQRLLSAGLPVVVSAGNDNTNACGSSPARVPGALTVAATDKTDTRAAFSSYGSCVDLFAPGVQVPSATNASDTGANYANGTSTSGAHVTGLLARLLQDPTVEVQYVDDYLLDGAVPGVVRDAHGSPNRQAFATNPWLLPPTMPQTVRVTADNANARATLSWAPPASNGGSPITGYRVSRDGTDSVGVGPWSTILPATARSQTFINLARGRTYTLTVEALSAYYLGEPATAQVVIP
jgi:hypothetical protein